MALLWRLLLAHLIADFPLQTDSVFAVKKEKGWGVFLHGTLFGLVAILLAKPFLKMEAVWGGLFILWLFHIAIDKGKLILVGGGRKDHLVYFLLDQALHIGSVILIGLLLNRIPRISVMAMNLEANVPLIKLGIAYVISVWGSPLICFYIHKTVSSEKLEFTTEQSSSWRMLGYAERWMLTTIVAVGGRLFLLSPLIFLPRVGFSLFADKRTFSRWEFVLGSIIAISAGVWAAIFGVK
jgi:hypothetical protein